MSVYLGDSGQVAIRRMGQGAGLLRSSLDPEDVNVSQKRFSFDFPPGAIITGDRLHIETTDGTNLVLVDGHNFPDGTWYAHADEAGGLRLYDNYPDSINGHKPTALTLVSGPTQEIIANTVSSDYSCVAQVKNYDFTSSREQVDTTSLGEEHRASYKAGLISGQGNLTCIWDWRQDECDPMQQGVQRPEYLEEPQYFASLILRLQLGAQFGAQFFINKRLAEKWLWWEAECLVSNVAFNFSPEAIIETQISFVTTGPIHMKSGRPEAFLLQENNYKIDLESEQNGFLLLEEPD